MGVPIIPDHDLIPDSWERLRRFTAARIATGRAGASLPTAELLRFGIDHAAARDAVNSALDAGALEAALGAVSMPIVRVASRVANRLEYLKRPDLGRRLDPESRQRLNAVGASGSDPPDIVIVMGDGLSAIATQTHGPALTLELVRRLVDADLCVGSLVLATFARVALQDEIGEVLKARSCLILLGERPGLGAPDSLGAYLVYGPREGNTDANRNCVSNIRPDGLPISAAAETLEYLITESLRRRLSGTGLKDERAVQQIDDRKLGRTNSIAEQK